MQTLKIRSMPMGQLQKSPVSATFVCPSGYVTLARVAFRLLTHGHFPLLVINLKASVFGAEPANASLSSPNRTRLVVVVRFDGDRVTNSVSMWGSPKVCPTSELVSYILIFILILSINQSNIRRKHPVRAYATNTLSSDSRRGRTYGRS